MTKRNLLLICLSYTLVFFVSCKKDKVEPAPVNPVTPSTLADNDPLLLGNPTNAKTDANMSENYLIDQTWYKEAYSESRGIPVWVGWHLQSSDLGSTPRQDDFRPDTKLPSGWYRVQASSYNYAVNGFDRGHNIPSADRTVSVPANSSTFLMTNMIPQAPTLNQGPWAGMEDYVRAMVGTTKEAYIYMGNYGIGGTSGQGYRTTIDDGRVTVPEYVYKVVIVLPKGSDDLNRIDTSATVLVVNMPNDNRLYTTTTSGKDAWKTYITTINNLEAIVNAQGLPLNFLSAVNSTVRSYLKAKTFR